MHQVSLPMWLKQAWELDFFRFHKWLGR